MNRRSVFSSFLFLLSQGFLGGCRNMIGESNKIRTLNKSSPDNAYLNEDLTINRWNCSDYRAGVSTLGDRFFLPRHDLNNQVLSDFFIEKGVVVNYKLDDNIRGICFPDYCECSNLFAINISPHLYDVLENDVRQGLNVPFFSEILVFDAFGNVIYQIYGENRSILYPTFLLNGSGLIFFANIKSEQSSPSIFGVKPGLGNLYALYHFEFSSKKIIRLNKTAISSPRFISYIDDNQLLVSWGGETLFVHSQNKELIPYDPFKVKNDDYGYVNGLRETLGSLSINNLKNTEMVRYFYTVPKNEKNEISIKTLSYVPNKGLFCYSVVPIFNQASPYNSLFFNRDGFIQEIAPDNKHAWYQYAVCNRDGNTIFAWVREQDGHAQIIDSSNDFLNLPEVLWLWKEKLGWNRFDAEGFVIKSEHKIKISNDTISLNIGGWDGD